MSKELSLDAKCVLGSMFQRGMKVNYQMIESRPTARMQAALDELVAAEYIVKTNLPTRADKSHGVQYQARVPVEKFQRFATKANIILAEPIK